MRSYPTFNDRIRGIDMRNAIRGARLRRGMTLAEVVVVTGLACILFGLFIVIYRFMFVKQTISTEMMESIRDIVLAVNYLKSDMNSALVAPGIVVADAVGKQVSSKRIEEAIGASVTPNTLSPGDGKAFSMMITSGSATVKAAYEIDASSNFIRTTYDENGRATEKSVLSKGKIVGASLGCKLFKEGEQSTAYMTLKLKVQTKTIEKSGLAPVTREFAFNIFPYILNNTIRNTEFER